MTILVTGQHVRAIYLESGNPQLAACQLFREGVELVTAKQAAKQLEGEMAAEAAYVLRETESEAEAWRFLRELGWPERVIERTLWIADAQRHN